MFAVTGGCVTGGCVTGGCVSGCGRSGRQIAVADCSVGSGRQIAAAFRAQSRRACPMPRPQSESRRWRALSFGRFRSVRPGTRSWRAIPASRSVGRVRFLLLGLRRPERRSPQSGRLPAYCRFAPCPSGVSAKERPQKSRPARRAADRAGRRRRLTCSPSSRRRRVR